MDEIFNDEELLESKDLLDDDDTFDALRLLRSDMLNEARKKPYEVRRIELEWTSILDEDGIKRNKPCVIAVCDLSTKHLEKILKWVSYDFDENYDIVLHTIKEEYDWRKKHSTK